MRVKIIPIELELTRETTEVLQRLWECTICTLSLYRNMHLLQLTEKI